tara:strand:- start:224 stop:376 length:153 start_codon:yes stop_codon:yes gene_type:complete
MDYYRKKYKTVLADYINSKKYGQNVLSLPVYPKLTDNNIDKICKIINRLS